MAGSDGQSRPPRKGTKIRRVSRSIVNCMKIEFSPESHPYAMWGGTTCSAENGMRRVGDSSWYIHGFMMVSVRS